MLAKGVQMTQYYIGLCVGVFVGNLVIHTILGNPIKGLAIGTLAALICAASLRVIRCWPKGFK